MTDLARPQIKLEDLTRFALNHIMNRVDTISGVIKVWRHPTFQRHAFCPQTFQVE